MYGDVERGMPVLGEPSNYGSACVFQEDRWNLMEPNGYGFEVKVSRREPTLFFLDEDYLPIRGY